MNRFLPTLALLLAPAFLQGCKGCAEETPLPTVLTAVDAAPTGLWVGEGVGVTPVSVPVFATNSLGAAVPGVEIAVNSTGTLVSGIVASDATGWGTATVEGVEGLYPVDATIAGSTAAGSAWIVPSRPGAFEYPASARGGGAVVSAVAVAGDGVVWAIGDTLWWGAPGGAPPVRVAVLTGDVAGMVACSVDSDGRTDLLAWSSGNVVLLRGRDAGGLYFGAGWNSAGGVITGASIVDHTADSRMDLAVVANAEGAADVLLLEGDGRWGFQPMDALHVDYQALALGLEDLDEDGDHEITLLTEDGLLRRYARFEEGWSTTTTSSEFDLEMKEGTRMPPAVDVTGDGKVDLIAYGPLSSSTAGDPEWQAWVVTAGTTTPIMYQMFSGGQDYSAPASLGLATGDVTGDGVADLVLSTPTSLTRASWSTGDDTFRLQSYQLLPHGPLAVGALAEDDVPDLVIGGDWIGVVPGAVTLDDTATPDDDESVPWRPRTAAATVFDLDASGEPWIGDLTGDGIAEVVTVVETTGLYVSSYLGVAATDTTEETLYATPDVLLADGATLVDFAFCGDRAFVLGAASDGTSYLYRADVSRTGAATLVDSIVVNGAAVVCGDFADGEAAVVTSDGTVQIVNDPGTLVASASVGAWVDVAAGDVDGDGFAAVVTCVTDGCELAVGDFDGDGIDDVATQNPLGTLDVSMGGAIHTLASPGSPRATDADGDGRVDLVLGESGAVHVHHGVTGGLAPAAVSYVWRPVTGPALFGDLDGDGIPDAFFSGRDPDEDDDSDSWTGSLLYARSSAAP